MDEALAKFTRKRSTVSMTISSAQAADKTTERVGPPLQNGPPLPGGGVPPPGWVAWLPPGSASLAVLSYFYAGASELERVA
jgi:hypothetical protein